MGKIQRHGHCATAAEPLRLSFCDFWLSAKRRLVERRA
jgi:hypothetical protein